MRHTFYANNREKTPDRGFQLGIFGKSKGFQYPGSRPAPAGHKDKKTLILESKLTKALDCYKDDQDTRLDIIDEYSLYRINLTLAIWYNDRDLEKKLYSDLMQYLDQKITERRDC